MSKYWRAVVVALTPLCVYIIPKWWLFDESHTLCLFHNLTGHDCWGCGMTRALVSVAYLDFYGAWHYNRAVVIVAPLLLYLWLRWVYNLVKFSK
ncbi:MAG: DUF2752 domain-containing protein [Alistipes sp.]|nr:DUF2752 domain-containing protein [Alistipes sp.]